VLQLLQNLVTVVSIDRRTILAHSSNEELMTCNGIKNGLLLKAAVQTSHILDLAADEEMMRSGYEII